MPVAGIPLPLGEGPARGRLVDRDPVAADDSVPHAGHTACSAPVRARKLHQLALGHRVFYLDTLDLVEPPILEEHITHGR
ncbi:hypothetical protein AB0N07_50045 [Streptomyces sp. NPDC051172]|uniref:hypothetical protein n=1 Tax=Streptomyces sp. NPDC051172 TaxID=3155796 RepID=UPI0034369ABD